MKKKIIIILILALILGFITFAVVKANTKMIIQGEIDSKNVDLSSKITGRVKKITVQKGDTVHKGDVLIILDTPDIAAKTEQAQAAVELAQSKALEVNNGTREEQIAMAQNSLHKAQSDLELARKTYNRINNLNNEGVVSNQKADEARIAYQDAQQGVKLAQNNLRMLENGSRYEDKLIAAAGVRQAAGAKREAKSYLDENVIRAPISGQVTDIPVEEGELVAAGYTIISITDLTDNWAVFNLREDLLSKIRMGTVFYVKVPALGNQKIKVKVNFISAMGNFSTWRATKIRGDFDLKTFEVHAKPVKTNTDLRAGMSVITDWNKIKR